MPFCDVFVAPHLEGPQSRPRRELAQDLSSQGVSFITADEQLLGRTDRIRAVTLECDAGLSATLPIAAAQVRRQRADAPGRVALEFAAPRPRVRLPRRLCRLTNGMYVPLRREDAPLLVRVMLGADGAASDRRAADRIRVPLEADISVLLERAGRVLATARLADVAQSGFGAVGPDGLVLGDAPDQVRLLWNRRELLRRPVEAAFVEQTVIREQRQSRLRIVIGGEGAHPMQWQVPLWAGPPEFGWVRLLEDLCTRPRLIQAALMVRDELVIAPAAGAAQRSEALDVSYETYVTDGIVDPRRIAREAWPDAFEAQSTAFVARAGSTPVGSLRLVHDGPARLPYHHYCPEALWPAQDVRSVEASRLAVSRAFRGDVNSQLGVAMLLVSHGFQHCVSNGYDRVLVAVQPHQEGFYQTVGFAPLSDAFRHPSYGVPLRLYGLMVAEARVFRRLIRRFL